MALSVTSSVRPAVAGKPETSAAILSALTAHWPGSAIAASARATIEMSMLLPATETAPSIAVIFTAASPSTLARLIVACAASDNALPIAPASATIFTSRNSYWRMRWPQSRHSSRIAPSSPVGSA